MDKYDDGRPRTYYRLDRLGDWDKHTMAGMAQERMCPTCRRTAMPYDPDHCPRCGTAFPAAEAV